MLRRATPRRSFSHSALPLPSYWVSVVRVSPADVDRRADHAVQAVERVLGARAERVRGRPRLAARVVLGERALVAARRAARDAQLLDRPVVAVVDHLRQPAVRLLALLDQPVARVVAAGRQLVERVQDLARAAEVVEGTEDRREAARVLACGRAARRRRSGTRSGSRPRPRSPAGRRSPRRSCASSRGPSRPSCR